MEFSLQVVNSWGSRPITKLNTLRYLWFYLGSRNCFVLLVFCSWSGPGTSLNTQIQHLAPSATPLRPLLFLFSIYFCLYFLPYQLRISTFSHSFSHQIVRVADVSVARGHRKQPAPITSPLRRCLRRSHSHASAPQEGVPAAPAQPAEDPARRRGLQREIRRFEARPDCACNERQVRAEWGDVKAGASALGEVLTACVVGFAECSLPGSQRTEASRRS